MKILALQTDVEVFLRQYTIEGEQQLLVAHYHWITFFIRIYRQVIVALFLLVFYVIMMSYEAIPPFYALLAIIVWTTYIGYCFLSGYISFKFNFLIVTSEKVVIVDQRSFFYQHVNPMQLNTIVSTDVNSQFFGILNCGRLVLNLTERTEYSSKQLKLDYLPNAVAIAGVIENAIMLDKKRKSDDEDMNKQPTEMHELHEKADVATTAVEPLLDAGVGEIPREA